MAQTYNVTFVKADGTTISNIKINEDEYILYAAEEQGIKLPVDCNAGTCSTCAAQLLEGSVEQDHEFFNPKQFGQDAVREVDKQGFILTCRSKPQSDCKILVDQEEALNVVLNLD
jgi:ferredoxin